MMPAKTKAVPRINPREQLTKKARKAIHQYVYLKVSKHDFIAALAIDIVLEAERMRRSQLYSWLESRGYRWNGYSWLPRHSKGGSNGK